MTRHINKINSLNSEAIIKWLYQMQNNINNHIVYVTWRKNQLGKYGKYHLDIIAIYYIKLLVVIPLTI